MRQADRKEASAGWLKQFEVDGPQGGRLRPQGPERLSTN